MLAIRLRVTAAGTTMPRPLPSDLTSSDRKALDAVERGEVMRLYRGDGNVLKGPKGIASQTLWRLDRAGYINDGERIIGGCINQVVTSAGQAARRAR